jgi:hypothetical protein
MPLRRERYGVGGDYKILMTLKHDEAGNKERSRCRRFSMGRREGKRRCGE